MTSNEVADAVVEWARVVLPALTNGYDHMVSTKEELPDVVAEILNSQIQQASQDFPFAQLQQVLIFRHDLELSFMVENTVPATAAHQLRDFADALTDSVLNDGTLGGRVPFISPYVTFDYTPPFVQYADGTEGREMTMTLSVADPVEVTQ